MKEQVEKYEDRYGSPDFEQGKGANTQKIVSRKENIQMRKYGIKPSDTLFDKIKKVLAEQKPSNLEQKHKEKINAKMKDSISKQDASAIEYLRSKGISDEKIEQLMQKPIKDYATQEPEVPEDDMDEDEQEKDLFDPEEENRISAMQALNPRIMKQKEKKEYMTRSNVQEEIIASLNEIAAHKLDLLKAAIALNLQEKINFVTEEVEQLEEANRNITKQGRTNIVKLRVRGGKIQRRKKVSAVKGYTVRGGKLKRMSVQERLRRKRGQRRGKIKRRAKQARALMRRKRSMRKRSSLGLKE